MATVKLTMYFLQKEYGWSETWYKDGGSEPNLDTFLDTFGVPLMLKRKAMLCPEASLTAVGASDESINGDSVLRYLGGGQAGTCAGHSDSPHTTVYTIVRATGANRRKAVFFRGQPDDVVLLGGVFQAAPPGAPPTQGIPEFISAATEYLNTLRSQGWGWIANSVTAEGRVENYVALPMPDGRVTLTCSAGFLPAFVGGAKPVFRRCRVLFKGIKSKLNGIGIYEQVSATELNTLKPVAVFPFTKDGAITRYTPVLQTFVGGSWSLQKTGRRAAGRPLLVTPGRQKETARG